MRVLAVADSDSYVKWAAAVLNRTPPGWRTELVALDTDVSPSERQLRAALSGSGTAAVPMLDLAAFTARVAATRPDVVIFATRGLMIRVLVRAIEHAVAPRPVFVSGLPGISIPATRKALYYRAQMDLMLLHSTREIREFAGLAAEAGIEQDFALARLPFLPSDVPDRVQRRGDLVFAAQAKVPEERDDRRRVLHWLAEAARHDQTRTVVLKLRGSPTEAQTHAERHPYDELLRELRDVPGNLEVAYGSMREHLDRASGLVTVSSTAAIEALALGLPVLVLDEFGVDRRLINTVFVGSGLFGSARAMIDGRLTHPEPAWLADNYFHPPGEQNWVPVIERLAARRRIGPVPLRAATVRTIDGPLRRAWDRRTAFGSRDRSLSGRIAMTIGAPARAVYTLARRVRRLVVSPSRVDAAPALPTAPELVLPVK